MKSSEPKGKGCYVDFDKLYQDYDKLISFITQELEIESREQISYLLEFANQKFPRKINDEEDEKENREEETPDYFG